MTTDTSIGTETILLVDDNPTNLKLTRFLLVSEGYQVVTAEDGSEALAILKETRPDLVLMDVQLPGTDGLEVTRQLRADPATRGLKVVALTAYAMKGDEEKARQAGCDGYIAKPIDTRTFPDLVRRYLAQPSQGGAEKVSEGGIRSILLVEDNAVQRKLVEIRLTEAGYRVVSASDGAEALDIARRDRPDLVVSDVLMPRLDGFRLCEAIRSDPDLANTHVLLTTSGSVHETDESLARAKGAAGFLHKTEDGKDLLAWIRAGSKTARAPSSPEPIGDLEPLRQSFLSDGLACLDGLLGSEPESWNREELGRMAHRWAGTGGTLGFPQISQTAFRLERLLETGEGELPEVEKAAEALRLLFDQGRRSESAQGLPEPVRRILDAKRFALAGFSRNEARRISEGIEESGGFVRLITEFASEVVADVAILDADTLAGAGSEIGPLSCPTLLVGGAESLSKVDRRGDVDFLVSPAQTGEILLRCYHLLTRPGRNAAGPSPSGPARVLIADDDPTVLALLESALGSVSIECVTAASGGEAIERAYRTAFDAILLDVNLPEKDGFEVLSTLQNDPATKSTPIVMLTARQQESDVLRAFALGAHDYVTKPFSPMEVIARLERLLER